MQNTAVLQSTPVVRNGYGGKNTNSHFLGDQEIDNEARQNF